MKKIIALLLLLSAQNIYSLPADKARGLFISFGVGPRLPIGTFSDQSDLGYGFNLELSYTDNEYIPMFLFAKAGFDQYPGSNDFYRSTDYSTYSVNSFPLNIGMRYFFAPMLENVALFMPIIEVSASLNYYAKLHQFKIGSGRSNFMEDILKFGVSGGIGISMFLLEIFASYNYYDYEQFLAADIRVRLPLNITY